VKAAELMGTSVERLESIVGDRAVVELRVHGVSGTPPNELLDRDEVRRVDQRGPTGFYRPADSAQELDHNGDQRPDAYLEGYAWGGLTSGALSALGADIKDVDGPWRGARGSMKLGVRRPPTSCGLGAGLARLKD
jgi:hypothetical protein